MMSECEIASVINMSEPTPLDAAGENWSRRALEKRDALWRRGWRRGWCREYHALSHDKGERIDRLIASFQADHAAVRSERPEWIWPRCFAIPPPEGISLPLIRQSLSRRAGSSKTLLVLWRMRRWFRGLKRKMAAHCTPAGVLTGAANIFGYRIFVGVQEFTQRLQRILRAGDIVDIQNQRISMAGERNHCPDGTEYEMTWRSQTICGERMRRDDTDGSTRVASSRPPRGQTAF